MGEALGPGRGRRAWVGRAVDAVMTHWLLGMDPSNGDEATEALMEWWASDDGAADAALELVHMVATAIESAGFQITPVAGADEKEARDG